LRGIFDEHAGAEQGAGDAPHEGVEQHLELARVGLFL
jgi:hypothetical protein